MLGLPFSCQGGGSRAPAPGGALRARLALPAPAADQGAAVGLRGLAPGDLSAHGCGCRCEGWCCRRLLLGLLPLGEGRPCCRVGLCARLDPLYCIVGCRVGLCARLDPLCCIVCCRVGLLVRDRVLCWRWASRGPAVAAAIAMLARISAMRADSSRLHMVRR
jgi:hypothetical protein